MGDLRTSVTAAHVEAAVAEGPTPHRLVIWEPDARLHGAMHSALGDQHDLWETTFVRTAEQLRAAMDHLHFDVVLVDVEAAGAMASILGEVGIRAPWALRVVMGRAGQDREMVDAIGAAHRFVARPVDLPRLLDDLAATLRRRDAFRDVEALRLAFANTALPAAPGIWLALNQALQDPEVGAAEMGEIVERDVAVAAKALSLANSAWFGLPRRVTDVRDAVVLLGGEAVQALVLAAELAGLVGVGVDADWMLSFESHAAKVARAATVVAPPRLRREAIAASLLHDIGTLVLMRHHPAVVRASADMDLGARMQLEFDLIGATHAEIGAMLLDAWGLPDAIVDAVLDHHRPALTVRREMTLAGVVHVADALVRDPEGVEARGLAHVRDLGIGDRVEGWLEQLQVSPAERA